MSESIPDNIITGALGAGKTTAIAQLLASKAAREPWLVILNEFTDTGIDALTLATSARGAYEGCTSIARRSKRELSGGQDA
jgi:G3E family GTPase